MMPHDEQHILYVYLILIIFFFLEKLYVKRNIHSISLLAFCGERSPNSQACDDILEVRSETEGKVLGILLFVKELCES